MPDNSAMAIASYLKDIGRGKDGARALTREHAADLMGQLLDGQLSDLEIGAFCLAMRIKGETAAEMAGFLDATESRLQRLSAEAGTPVVVLPSYNGARRLPLLTPLLAHLLARQGMAVLVHGARTEATRITSDQVFEALGLPALTTPRVLRAGEVTHLSTQQLHAGLQRLLEVRQVVGLRNSAHSLVKLMNPMTGPALIVGCYTHPEYAQSMAETFALRHTLAVLLRGTEGEPVADPRRCPLIEGWHQGQRHLLQPAQEGSLATLPDLPVSQDIEATVRYTQAVLAGQHPVPEPLRLQVERIVGLARTSLG
jgi:anthranilate phosphoribosyltransferase